MKVFQKPLLFEWDAGNRDKNLLKHSVSNEECEEIFFDPDRKIAKDALHSGKENRYILLGKTKKGKVLFVVFAMRDKKVRVISARDLNKKEKHLYSS